MDSQAVPTPAPESAADDLIPARMLNEIVYCPRLYWLEHVAGEWEDSGDTLSGRRVHRRVDTEGPALPPPDELPSGFEARSVAVQSQDDGITAKLDLVQARDDGYVTPVDYKRGSAPSVERVPTGVWPADRVQVGAQALALRASGYACDGGVVYYAASKARVPVPLTPALIADVRAAVAEARRLRTQAVAPPALIDSPKCPRCSLVGICLPDETRALLNAPTIAPEQLLEQQAARRADVEAQADVSEEEDDDLPGAPQPPLRRLLPADDGRQPCHVQAAGATIGKSGGVLEIRYRDGQRQDVAMRSLSHLSLYGQVHITTAALQALCDEGLGVSFFSSGGWYYGALGNVGGHNVPARLAQFQAATNPGAALRLARAFVRGKLLNCRTLLRRNAQPAPQRTLARLRQLAHEVTEASDLAVLMGLEGTGARLYFESFASLLQPRSGDRTTFDFEGRNRRPPRDPINALLSFAYAVLLKECRIALTKVGLDPSVGFLHQVRPGRPALALDLMEEFRPLLADSTVLSAVNMDVVQAADFVSAAGAVALRESARKAFLGTYERRLAQEVTHPLFGYRITWRRVLEVQARLLARTLTGELPGYPSFLTR